MLVVHGLEMVDVEHEAREWPAVASGRCDELRKSCTEVVPVQQPCQRVGRRLGGENIADGLRAKGSPHTSCELVRLERLDDIVDGAGVQTVDAGGVRAFAVRKMTGGAFGPSAWIARQTA